MKIYELQLLEARIRNELPSTDECHPILYGIERAILRKSGLEKLLKAAASVRPATNALRKKSEAWRRQIKILDERIKHFRGLLGDSDSLSKLATPSLMKPSPMRPADNRPHASAWISR